MFVVALLASTLCLQAQNFEGTIKWKVTHEVMDPDVRDRLDKDPRGNLEARMPTGLTFKVKDNNTLTVIEGGIADGIQTLYLGDKNQSYNIDRGTRTYTRSPARPIAKYENAEVTRTSEIRKILGYTCTRYVMEVTEGEETEWHIFWITTDIKGFEDPALQTLIQNQLILRSGKIEGVPLRMEIRSPMGNMITEITGLKREKLAATDFVVPAGFKEIKQVFNFKARNAEATSPEIQNSENQSAKATNVKAGTFEGTLKWKITQEITDPEVKARKEKLKDPATRARMQEQLKSKIEMKMLRDPEFRALVESNPQVRAQIDAVYNGGDIDVLMPTGATLKVKGNNTLTVMEGGLAAGTEMLYLSDQDQSYNINRVSKTYSRPAAQPKTKNEDIKVTRTSETRNILGYTCTKYVVEMIAPEKQLQHIFWTTTDIKGFYLSTVLHGLGQDPDVFSEKIAGVPLRTEVKDAQGGVVMEVTELNQETLAATDFAVPAGFKEVKPTF